MCDNTKIHDQVQASIATATREVDAALQSVRAMRQAILAQMVWDTADLRNIKVTSDDVAEAIKTIRKHNADTDRGIYLEQGEYLYLMQFKDQVKRVRELHIQESEITTFCKECAFMYPCATIQALDGEIGSVEPVKLEALDGEQS